MSANATELAADLASVTERADRLEAERDRALVLLRRLAHRIERIGGHSTPVEQSDMLEARALLAEVGR